MLGLARARLSSSRVGQGALTPAARVWSLPARFAALGDGRFVIIIIIFLVKKI